MCIIIIVSKQSCDLCCPLCDTVCRVQGAITNSRQFPFRFFSAYEVLHELEAKYEKNRMYTL